MTNYSQQGNAGWQPFNFGQPQWSSGFGGSPGEIAQLTERIVSSVLSNPGSSQQWNPQGSGSYSFSPFGATGYGYGTHMQFRQPDLHTEIVKAVVPEVVRACLPILLSNPTQNPQLHQTGFGFQQTPFSSTGYGFGGVQTQFRPQEGNLEIVKTILPEILRALLPTLLSTLSGNPQYNLQGFGYQPTQFTGHATGSLPPQHIAEIVRAVVPAVLNSVSMNPQFQGFHTPTQGLTGFGTTPFSGMGGAGAYPPQYNVAEIVKAVVPLVLTTLSATSQSGMHVN
jgi:hypothetical protein